MVVIIVYMYGVRIIKKFRLENGFLWGVPWNPPYALTEVRGTLVLRIEHSNSKDYLSHWHKRDYNIINSHSTFGK